MSRLDEVSVTIDELEALRLADLDGLYQEHAAQKMKVSRQTFGRIVSSARALDRRRACSIRQEFRSHPDPSSPPAWP